VTASVAEPKLCVPELDITTMMEDVILVTEDGYENLSARASTTVRDIERIMTRS
jgi:Xaa-Pro aminopeptidase